MNICETDVHGTRNKNQGCGKRFTRIVWVCALYFLTCLGNSAGTPFGYLRLFASLRLSAREPWSPIRKKHETTFLFQNVRCMVANAGNSKEVLAFHGSMEIISLELYHRRWPK